MTKFRDLRHSSFVLRHSSYERPLIVKTFPMKLTSLLWLVFAFCLLAVLGAMGWLSATAMRLDRAEVESRRQAAVEEKVRLALWRMDSKLAPLVAQESARPFFAYLAYFPADRSPNGMFDRRRGGERLIASPLMAETPPRILLHFQLDQSGVLSSPQMPVGDNRQTSPSLELDSEVRAKREEYFELLQKTASAKKLADLLPEPKLAHTEVVYSSANVNKAEPSGKLAKAMNQEIAQGDAQSLEEYAQRKRVVEQNTTAMLQSQFANAPSTFQGQSAAPSQNRSEATPSSSTPPLPPQAALPLLDNRMASNRQPQAGGGLLPSGTVQPLVTGAKDKSQLSQQPADQPQPNDAFLFTQQPSNYQQPQAQRQIAAPPPNTDFGGVQMTPLWIDGELILARRIIIDGRQYVQGCLLDWPDIRRWLLGEIADLLPAADLEPSKAADAAEEPRLLAALPIRLVPGSVAVEGDKSWSPLLLSLVAAWLCLVVTSGAVAALLWGVVRLSARRASFVTAVTHELRTPLTTFQMYAEMLAEGMVPEESQRKSYLNTLRAEAVRLTHLVENVLAYARLERGRLDRRAKIVSLGELIDSMQSRLADRAMQAGMELSVEDVFQAGEIAVKTNVSAAEQILFNLVDNACKYATSAEDHRIRLVLAESGGFATVRVEDFGPGIAPEMRRRLFRSFSKTAKEAAHSAPGVGLGLALSRRLARDLGGDLIYVERDAPGSCFELTLPKA
jgi:signal transduction histidine kinase